MDMTADTIREIATLALGTGAATRVIEAGKNGEHLLVNSAGGGKITVADLTRALELRQPHPRERSGTVALAHMESFITFCRMWREPTSVLFADPNKNAIQCVFDWHDPVDTLPSATLSIVDATAGQPATLTFDPVEPPKPRWGRFRATYAFPLSEQWKAWSQSNGKEMDQEALAAHIEANALDIVSTNPKEVEASQPGLHDVLATLKLRLGNATDLITLARDFDLHVNQRVRVQLNTSTGEVTAMFTEAHSGDGEKTSSTSIPTAFLISVPIFAGAPPQCLLVRLRYRSRNSTVVWFYDVYQLERAMIAAFESSCVTIAEQVEVPLFYGTPPSAEFPMPVVTG